jgi:tetratricopeptide (TPR) repeat protein
MEIGKPAADAIAAAFAQAIAKHRAGDLAGAIAGYRELLARVPDHGHALNNLGIALKAEGRLGEARDILARATSLHPDNPHFGYNLGNALGALGDAKAAAAEYRRVLAKAPDHVGALGNLGLLLLDRGEEIEARNLLERALARGVDRLDAWHNLGTALFRSEKWEAAAVCFRRALALDASSAKTWCHLGLALSLLGEFAEAGAAHRRALAIEPKLAAALAGLGQVEVSLGHLAQGEAFLRQAVGIEPELLDARLGLARVLLLSGRLEEGWPAYAWRWKRPGVRKPHRDRPEWLGERASPMTILVHVEQGLGDAVQFLRYVPQLAALGHRVRVEVPGPLKRLAATLSPGIEVSTQDDARTTFDRHVALLDLPWRMGTTLATIPTAVPYLGRTRDRSGTTVSGKALRVGLAWAGSPKHSGDRLRSVPFSFVLALTDIPGTAWTSLQVGEASGDLAKAGRPSWIEDSGPRLRDLEDTAEVMRNLDLVVTVDTAVAHLAGALGIPVWVALPFAPDWRWMTERSDSPWYPTMRLYRQDRPGHWAGAFKRIYDDLVARAREWTKDGLSGKTGP